MKDANVKAKINGDASGFVRASAEAKATAQRDSGAIAQAYASVAVSVKAVTQAAHGLKAALGEIQLVATIVASVISAVKNLRDWIVGATEATDEFAEAAKKLGEGGVSASIFSALKEQADAAGMAADEFSEKLKQFKEHKITFDQLAASIGTTAAALHGAAAGPTGEMAGLVAEYAARDAASKDAEVQSAARGKALDRLVREIYRETSDIGGPEELWDKLLGAAGGDVGRAREGFLSHRSFRDRLIGPDIDIDRELGAASRRYAARQAEREAAARAETEAADKETARLAAEEKAKADKAAAEEKARADEKARKEREAAEAAEAARQGRIEDLEARQVDARWKAQLEKDSIRVSQPAAINSYNAVGGLVGADPTALNAARMEAERARAVADIDRKCADAVAALQKQIDILRGE